MQVAKSILLLMTGAMTGNALMLSCGDNLAVTARADAAMDPKPADAAPGCDCPAAEPPLADRFVVLTNDVEIPGNEQLTFGKNCPAGSQLITGACMSDFPQNVTLSSSGFYGFEAGGWACSFHNNVSTPVRVYMYVRCLKSAP